MFNSLDEGVFEESQKWINDNHQVILATVIKTWGSSPRPEGSMLAIGEQGRVVGSVSGGCVEGDVLERAQLVLAGAPPVLRRYGVADGAAWDVGLPCGGDIQVLVQPVSADGFPAHLFADIIKARSAGAALSVVTDLESGRSALLDDDAGAGFVNIYHPPRRLLIVGAVEIASALAAIAVSQGVDVTLCDPRGRFLTAERFPGIRLDDRWPDDAVKAFVPDSRSAIVTLSHDPKIDDPALVEHQCDVLYGEWGMVHPDHRHQDQKRNPVDRQPHRPAKRVHAHLLRRGWFGYPQRHRRDRVRPCAHAHCERHRGQPGSERHAQLECSDGR